jgi:hypothetical protein
VFGSLPPYEDKDIRLVSLAELGEAGIRAEGQPEDRDADLFFKIPAIAAQTIKNSARVH